MDLLTDVLSQCGLRRNLLKHRAVPKNWAIAFPCDRSIGFHVVTQGEVHIRADKKLIHLQRGDMVLMARGVDHVVATDLKAKPVPCATDMGAVKNPCAVVVSGVYQFWNEPLHPFLRGLPDWITVRANELESFGPMHACLQLLAQESAKPDVGSESVTRGLLDIVFTFVLRKVIASGATKPGTWSHAVNDPQIHRALQLLHAQWAQPWTLQRLAKEAGVSRAGLALRFKKTMGDTPLHYLTMLRMQRAMEMLARTDESIEAIAAKVGYQDAFAFSKSFKRATGQPPSAFRKDHAAQPRDEAA